jgi:hypothetical protein
MLAQLVIGVPGEGRLRDRVSAVEMNPSDRDRDTGGDDGCLSAPAHW